MRVYCHVGVWSYGDVIWFCNHHSSDLFLIVDMAHFFARERLVSLRQSLVAGLARWLGECPCIVPVVSSMVSPVVSPMVSLWCLG